MSVIRDILNNISPAAGPYKEKARAELAELERDRARLEWLENNPGRQIYQGEMTKRWFYCWKGMSAEGEDYPTFRAAIDAALEAPHD